MIPRTRESVAFHEAGHAVVAMALDLPCHGALIKGFGAAAVGGFAQSPDAPLAVLVGTPQIHEPPPTGYHAGLASFYASHKKIELESACARFATMCVAGVQAEFLYAGAQWPEIYVSGDKDHVGANAFLRAANCLHRLGAVQHGAREILLREWHQVEKIALELLENGQWVASD